MNHVYSDGVSYAVAEQPLGHDWERARARLWHRRSGTLLEPDLMGSIVAHTGGSGSPWREVPFDQAPEPLRALIAG